MWWFGKKRKPEKTRWCGDPKAVLSEKDFLISHFNIWFNKISLCVQCWIAQLTLSWVQITVEHDIFLNTIEYSKTSFVIGMHGTVCSLSVGVWRQLNYNYVSIIGTSPTWWTDQIHSRWDWKKKDKTIPEQTTTQCLVIGENISILCKILCKVYHGQITKLCCNYLFSLFGQWPTSVLSLMKLKYVFI